LIASGIELTPAIGTAVADVAAGAEAAWTTTGPGDWALAATKASNTGRKKRILARIIFPVSNKSGAANGFGDCSEFLFNLRLIFGELRLLCLDFFDQRQKSLFLVRVRRLRAATMT
jgi:hypothetical protein